MITIGTKIYGKDEVKESFLRAFAEMTFAGMAMSSKVTPELTEKALRYFNESLPVNETESGLEIGTEDEELSVEDGAAALAWELFKKNSYSSEFGSSPKSTLAYVAQKLLDKYPEIEFEGQIYLDTQWSNTLETVCVADGQVESEIEYE